MWFVERGLLMRRPRSCLWARAEGRATVLLPEKGLAVLVGWAVSGSLRQNSGQALRLRCASLRMTGGREIDGFGGREVNGRCGLVGRRGVRADPAVEKRGECIKMHFGGESQLILGKPAGFL